MAACLSTGPMWMDLGVVSLTDSLGLRHSAVLEVRDPNVGYVKDGALLGGPGLKAFYLFPLLVVTLEQFDAEHPQPHGETH